MGDKIDFSLLAVVLNAGVSVILLGGLILDINPAQLIMIGVLGYGMGILFRRIGRNQAGIAPKSKSKRR